jgi:hypothetical protein
MFDQLKLKCIAETCQLSNSLQTSCCQVNLSDTNATEICIIVSIEHAINWIVHIQDNGTLFLCYCGLLIFPCSQIKLNIKFNIINLYWTKFLEVWDTGSMDADLPWECRTISTWLALFCRFRYSKMWRLGNITDLIVAWSWLDRERKRLGCSLSVGEDSRSRQWIHAAHGPVDSLGAFKEHQRTAVDGVCTRPYRFIHGRP